MSGKQTAPTDQTVNPKPVNETTEANLYVFDKSSLTDWQGINNQNTQKGDPTCGGVLAPMSIDYNADDFVPVIGGNQLKLIAGDKLDEYLGLKQEGPQRNPEKAPDKTESSFFAKLTDKIADEVLKKEVASLLKGFGDEDFKVREKAESAARKLGPKALTFLKDGLKSEDPEVRARTERVLGAITRGHINKWLKPVNELYAGFTKMALDDNLTPELRKKFEEKIKMADELKDSKEDLDLAFDMYKEGDPGDPNFLDRLNEKYHLKEAPEMRAEARLWYASKLAKSKEPADQKRAMELLKEAVKIEGWKKSPGLIKDAVDSLGGVDKMPKEIQEAYKISQQQIKKFDRESRDSPLFPIRP